MKVVIIIVTYNLPCDIFLLQMEAIKKFCKDDYDIKVVDNSDIDKMAIDIKYHAENLELDYTKTYSASRNSSDSHTFACNYAFQKFKEEYDWFAYLDHDLIPVKPFSVIDILKGGHVIAGLGQQGSAKRVYMWPGCVMFHLEGEEKEIIDFSTLPHMDSGASLCHVIEKYGNDHCIFFNEAYYQNPDFNGTMYNSYAMIKDGTFLHFQNSSNWNNQPRHEERLNSLLNLTRKKIDDYVDK